MIEPFPRVGDVLSARCPGNLQRAAPGRSAAQDDPPGMSWKAGGKTQSWGVGPLPYRVVQGVERMRRSKLYSLARQCFSPEWVVSSFRETMVLCCSSCPSYQHKLVVGVWTRQQGLPLVFCWVLGCSWLLFAL